MHRKLTAIMFTDIEGYTAMMREDEATTLGLRKRHREIFENCTAANRGRIVQYFGDGTLSVFDSSVDAVECALQLQTAFTQEPQIPVRIGIHVGDVAIYENDIIGDAVNIASRIESIAKSGSVFFSAQVNDQLRSHKRYKTKYLDVFRFKNVKEDIPIFALDDKSITVPRPDDVVGSRSAVSAINDSDNKENKGSHKPGRFRWAPILLIGLTIAIVAYFSNIFSSSATVNEQSQSPDAIAILPVQNLSGQEQNEMFCEAISNELVQQLTGKTAMGKMVPASLVNDYLSRGEPMNKLSDALGVRYLLEIALHEADSLFSLDMRLVDPLAQKYLWSYRYEDISEGNYIAKIQSGISKDIELQLIENSSALEELQTGEVLVDNKNVNELIRKADLFTSELNKEAFYKAIPLYEKAIQIDPELAEGYRGLGRIYLMGGMIWGIFEQEEAAVRSKAYLEKSMAIKPTLEASQFLLINKFFFEQDFDYVDEHLSLVAILPSFPDGCFYTVYCNIMGRFDESIRYAEKYINRFPNAGNGPSQMIRAYFLSGRLAEADSLMQKYDPQFVKDQFYMRDVAMVHLNMGNMKAFKAMNQILKTDFLDNAAVHIYFDAVALTHDGDAPENVKGHLEELKLQYELGMAGSPAWFLAMYYLYIGDDDTAFEWLKKSHQRKEVELTWFKTEHWLQPFRKAKDPRYMAIYNQMNWPE